MLILIMDIIFLYSVLLSVNQRKKIQYLSVNFTKYNNFHRDLKWGEWCRHCSILLGYYRSSKRENKRDTEGLIQWFTPQMCVRAIWTRDKVRSWKLCADLPCGWQEPARNWESANKAKHQTWIDSQMLDMPFLTGILTPGLNNGL